MSYYIGRKGGLGFGSRGWWWLGEANDKYPSARAHHSRIDKPPQRPASAGIKTRFFVKVEKIQNYPISAGGFEKRISEIGTYLHLTPLLEIDPEQEYAGPPRPHNLSGFELDIPNPKELGLMFNIPSDGLPLGHINDEKTTPFFYPLVPEDTRFQSWLIAGVQGKGKSIFVHLLPLICV